MNGSNDDLEFIDETMAARKKALAKVRDAASKGDDLAGMLGEMERLASPFFFGIDEDPDDSDMDVFP